MELLLGQLDFLRRPLLVEKTGTHGDRNLIEVPNLREDVVGGTTQLVVASTLRDRAPVPQGELRWREPLRELHDLVAAAAGDPAPVRKPRVGQLLVGEPQPAHILDSVE